MDMKVDSVVLLCMCAFILYHFICMLCNVTCVCLFLLRCWRRRVLEVSSLRTAHRTLTVHGGSGALSTIFFLRYQRSAEGREKDVLTEHTAGTGTYQASPPEQFNFSHHEVAKMGTPFRTVPDSVRTHRERRGNPGQHPSLFNGG